METAEFSDLARTARPASFFYTIFLREPAVLESVRCQSISYARRLGFAGVVTGHTHYADDFHKDEVHYLNTGCWTESPCAYVTVQAGQARLHQVPCH